ncbi:MAG TPA: hypothetical protein VF598_05800, partial [Hymenobacter sp.]
MRCLLPASLLLFSLVALVPTSVQAQATLSTTNTKARNLWEKAQEQSKARDFPKAIETLTQLNQKFPSLPEPFVMKGSMLKAMGENRAAFDAYRDGLAKASLDPARATDFYTLGELAMNFGDYQTAADSYKKYLKIAPKGQRNQPR